MSSYLLDTNHCIYLLNGLDKEDQHRSKAEKKVIEKARMAKTALFMSEATLGELYFGAANSERKEYNFERIEILKKAVIPIAIDDNIWNLFGKTKAILRKKGKSIMDLDLLIACTAKKGDCTLVTNDGDFDVLPVDFRMDNWT